MLHYAIEESCADNIRCAGAWHASRFMKRTADAVFQQNSLQDRDEMLIGDGTKPMDIGRTV